MELVSLDVLFKVFFIAIVVDFITGVLVASKNGKLKSRTCSNGMFRSIGEFIVLLMFIFTNELIPLLNPYLSTFIIGFIFMLLSMIFFRREEYGNGKLPDYEK